MNLSETTKLVGLIAGFYPGRMPVTDTVCRAWAWALTDVKAEDALLAARGLCLTSKWPPSLSDIRRRIFETSTGLPSAEEAWALASSCIGENPVVDRPIYQHNPEVPDLVHEVAHLLPLRDLARGDGAARAHFMRLYEERAERAFRGDVSPLLGSGAVENEKRIGGTRHIADVLPEGEL